MSFPRWENKFGVGKRVEVQLENCEWLSGTVREPHPKSRYYLVYVDSLMRQMWVPAESVRNKGNK